MATVVWLSILAAGALAQAQATGKDARRFWAYPDGVLVTSGAPRSPLTKEERTSKELSALAAAVESVLQTCARTTRNASPELVKRGERYEFTMTFGLDGTGAVHDSSLVRVGKGASLPECTNDALKVLAGYAFSPPKLLPQKRKGDDKRTPEELRKRPVAGIQIPFQMAILTDDEAQGRGYQYLAAERAWEQALRTNRHWFACSADADCIITYEMCEVRAINGKHEREFLAAVRLRKRESCPEPDRAEALTPTCLVGVCSTRNVGRRR